MSEFLLQNDQTMLFIGDSITDCGRRGAEAPLGTGYVRLFAELATAAYPDRAIRYINKGIGGDRISHLKERWNDDVLENKPDRMSIKIGINDLHSVLREAEDPVAPELFEEIYDELLTTTVETLGCPITLLTPFYISTDTTGDTFRRKVLDFIPEYIEIVNRMRERHKTGLVRLHDTFREHLKHRDAETFCPEPVHPNRAGHMVIAKALFDSLHR
jgi:lysophospholipase L1-like esterase